MRAAINQIRLNSSATLGQRVGARPIHTVAAKLPVSRFSSWSYAIANRRSASFPARAWHPENLTFWLGAWRRPTPQPSLRLLLQLHFSSPMQNVFLAPAARVCGSGGHRRLHFERAAPASPHSPRVGQAAGFPSLARAARPAPRQASAAWQSSSALPSARFGTFPALFSNAVFARERIVTKLLLAKTADRANDDQPAAVARRIGQKVRRVESGQVPVSRDFLAKRAAIVSSVDSFESDKSPRSATNSFDRYQKTPNAMAPAIDLRKVTDEVMQQIDRRIVASRERFGKI